MPDDLYRAVIAELGRHGYVFYKPAKGSHEKWRQKERGDIIIVPHNLKRRHTANSILKSAGSSVKL